jgi:3-oxoacyl-[acyl-carrier-protein] synthase-3
VTQTPDYHLPATSPLLQKRLGLSENCLALDISLGCSGFVYGLGVITSLLSHGNIRKGLLLAGDTILKTCSKNDKTTYPLFGDAGSATALEFQGRGNFLFNLKFGISKAPASIKELSEHFELNLESVDDFIFHQANKFMNEKIRKKLNLPVEKVPYSIERFGNTSCATIPLTMVTEMRDKLENNRLSHIACGFGVGLSWGSVYFETDKIIVPDLVEI